MNYSSVHNRYISRREIIGSSGNSVFKPLRNCQSLFQNGWSSSSPGGPEDLSLALTVLGWNRSRDVPSSSLQLSDQNHILSHPLSLGPANTIFLDLTWPPRFIRIIPLRWRSLKTTWSTCICGPSTPTFLWASSLMMIICLWRVWATFSQTG